MLIRQNFLICKFDKCFKNFNYKEESANVKRFRRYWFSGKAFARQVSYAVQAVRQKQFSHF